jgi:hypothetical protein
MPDTCLFCLRTATLTAEHIWDDWLTEVYQKETTVGEKFNFTDFGEAGEVLRKYDGNKIDKKTRVVCATCNNGWMSEITGNVKDIIKEAIVHGRKTTLSHKDFVTLARFVFLKGAVIDHLAPRPYAFFRPSVRREFRTTRALPHGLQIWISQFVSPKAEGQVWSIYSQPNDPKVSIFGSEFFTMTYQFGFVVLQLVAFRWISRTWRHKPLPSVTQHSIWDPVAVEIWPNRTAPLTWPSPQYLDADGRKAFRARWKNLNIRKRSSHSAPTD